jgi:site-specific recombinase XerD
MIAIRLYQQKDRVRADGTSQIFYVLAKGSKRKYIASKKYLSPNHFDNATGMVLRGADNSIKLNAFFKRQMTRLDDIIIDLMNEGHEPTFERIEQRFLNDHNDDFITFALDELESEKGLISYKTYVGYKNRLENLRKYQSAIPFKTITHTWLTTLRNHFILKGRSANGYYQDFAAIKKFYRAAVIKGQAKGNPFEHFRLDKEETVKAWLTRDELSRLRDLLDTKRITDAEKNTLRHFLFCCFTGIRFGDKRSFSQQNIVDGRIHLRTSKTGKYVTIPFNDQAQEFLPYVLSMKLKQGNSRVNTDLENCMAAAGVNKHITFHCSRHTFAINCLLAGVDLITVRDWLGHKSVTTTEIYAKIAAQYKDESMKKLDGFWSNTEVKGNERRNLVMQVETVKIDQEKRIEEARELKTKGMTNVAIAQQFGVSEAAVRKWLKQLTSY